jgi:hypothetical protein
MNKQLLTGIMTVALGALSATATFAQFPSKIKVEVPFNFEVGGKKLPAGMYGVELISVGSQVAVVNRADEPGQIFQVSARRPNPRGETPRLIFHRYGDRYFLRKMLYGSIGRDFRESQAETEVRVAVAKPSTVTVVARK